MTKEDEAEEEEEEEADQEDFSGAGPAAPHDVSSTFSSLRPMFLEPLVFGSLLFGVFSFLGSTVDTVVFDCFWNFLNTLYVIADLGP